MAQRKTPTAVPVTDVTWLSRSADVAVNGPLAGVRVIELGGIGPGPFAAMLLADMDADVLRIDRPGAEARLDPVLHRGRSFAAADLKLASDREAVLHLVTEADVLIEGFRPGVAERLGLGPRECHARNRRLIFGRMTGYGQEGPLHAKAGHDINYIAIAGALGAIGREGPVPPLNLIGDMGGGGMLLAFGIACALFESRSSGLGQVVDAAIVDGTALQLSIVLGMMASGRWTDQRAANTLDGGAPFYDAYRCADGEFVAVGAIEKQFYADLLKGLDLTNDPLMDSQWDKSRWPEMKSRLSAVIATKSRDAWLAVFDGLDACVTPVLSLHESARHHHNISREVYILDDGGALQPSPAPRFSRTKPQQRWRPDATTHRDPSDNGNPR